MLAEPGHTPYDFTFNIFGFDVRVNPIFFLMPLVLFGGLFQAFDINTGIAILIVEAVVFLSILVHELGHAFAFRYYGIDSHIVLYAMGGLAIPSSAKWTGGRSRSLTPFSQIIISLAGPIAGLLLAGVFVGIVYGLGGKVHVLFGSMFPVVYPDFLGTNYANKLELTMLIYTALFCGVFWNLLNLVPIYPLDGGQVARQIFLIVDPWNGLKNSLILSIVSAILVAIWSLKTGQTFMPIFFGFMAYENYMLLHSTGGRGRPW